MIPSSSWQFNDPFAQGPSGKSRGVTALLALFLGSLGIQYFYLGRVFPGIVFLLASICSCGVLGVVVAIISLIQGIMMFGMTNQQFEAKYVTNPDMFPIF